MVRLRFLFSFTLILLLPAAAAVAQTNVSTGQISGVVTDQDNGALPGVTITVTNVETGLTRTVLTETSGNYTTALLPPGKYRIEAELPGFGKARQENIIVLLGTSSNINLKITPKLSEEITVSASSPVVDATQSDSTTSVTQDQIENLPILGRDFRDLILLTPGAVDAGAGRVALNGAKGIGTDFNIDGAESNNDFFGEQRGGTEQPFSFSQAAIREFQVIRSTYSAEYGKGIGATMNAVTKSGTNEFDGQVFYFLRDKEWADERPLILSSGLSVVGGDTFQAKNSDQYGFALGGPIVQDRLHFFANADFQKISEKVTVEDIRNSTAFLALSPETRAAFVARVESLVGRSFDEELRYSTKEDQDTYLLKFDANVGSKHHASLRDNYSEFHNFPSENTATVSSQGDERSIFNTVVGQMESVLTSSLFNQLILQLAKDERPIEPLNTTIPFIQVFGVGPTAFQFGHNDFLPNNTIERKWQIKDSLAFIWNNHNFKTGLEYLSSDILNFFPREMSGEYQFNNVADFLAGRPSRFEQGMGPNNGANRFDYWSYGVFLQDTWKLFNRLTLDLGVRYDYQDLPTPKRNIAPEYPEFLANFENDDNNFAPRLGFAYDLTGNSRSVIRGGAGVYYSPMPSIVIAGPIAEIAGEYNRISLRCSATVACPTFPNIYTPEQFAGRIGAGGGVSILGDNYEAQESTRTSLGFEQQLGRSYSFGIDGVYAQLQNQYRLVNINAYPTGIVYGDLVQYNVTDPRRRYPRFSDVRRVGTDGESNFKSATVSFRKQQLGDAKLSWLAHYTWSESIDQDTSERSTSTAGSLDPFNPELLEGRSNNDVTHKAVLSGSYELPFGILVSGIYNWRSGIPFTPSISGLGNGLGSIGPTTPVFVDGNGQVIDLTAANGSSPAELQAFLAARDAHLQERNTENQPDFQNLDMRLSKRFNLFSDFQVEILGEVFNVLGDNIEFVTTRNQSVFTAALASNKWTFTRQPNYGRTNSYTFASEPRQIQAAVKLHF